MIRSNWSCSTSLKVNRPASVPRVFIAFFISMKILDAILDDILDILDDIFVKGGLVVVGERVRKNGPLTSVYNRHDETTVVGEAYVQAL